MVYGLNSKSESGLSIKNPEELKLVFTDPSALNEDRAIENVDESKFTG